MGVTYQEYLNSADINNVKYLQISNFSICYAIDFLNKYKFKYQRIYLPLAVQSNMSVSQMNI